MAGFALPKLRWLIVGAVAAGAWASTQEPPKRDHWRKQRETEVAATEKKRAEPKPAASARVPRPSELVTSSIPKPRKPSARPETLHTTEKVRLRKEASTSSDVVAMLKGGLSVTALSTDGKWRKVSVDGMVGWVHSDYLKSAGKTASDVAVVTNAPVIGEVPRPKESVSPDTIPVSAPADQSMWSAMRPTRVPQEGDCQCPYDIMLNGKQCGDRSAYAKGKGGECYF